MRTNRTETETPDSVQRHRCYACFRPQSDCFCDTIPLIDNQMDVLILQHTRERFHAFNTARIVHKALRNSRLLVGHTRNLPRCVYRFNPAPACSTQVRKRD